MKHAIICSGEEGKKHRGQFMLDNDAIVKTIPKIYNVPPLNGDGHDPSIEQIHELYLFCFVLLELPELLRLAVLDLTQALAASL